MITDQKIPPDDYRDSLTLSFIQTQTDNSKYDSLRRAAKTMKMIVHASSSLSWDVCSHMNLADRFQRKVWGDVVPFSYRMLRDVLPITIRIQASVIAILEVVSTIESNRRVDTQRFGNDVGICSQGHWNKKAPTDWNRGETPLGSPMDAAAQQSTNTHLHNTFQTNSNQF